MVEKDVDIFSFPGSLFSLPTAFAVILFSVSCFIFRTASISEVECSITTGGDNLVCNFRKTRPVLFSVAAAQFGINDELNFIVSQDSLYFYIRTQLSKKDITNIHPYAYPHTLKLIPHVVIKWLHVIDPFELRVTDPNSAFLNLDVAIAVGFTSWDLNSFQLFISDIDRMLQMTENENKDQSFVSKSNDGSTSLPHASFKHDDIIVPTVWGCIFAVCATFFAFQKKENKVDSKIKKQIETVKTLLEHGADISIPNNHIKIPGRQFRITVSSEEQHALNTIITGSSQDSETEAVKRHVWMGLLEACCNNTQATVEALLAKYPSLVSYRHEEDDSTPLHWAAGDGATTVGQLLLRRGADINAKNVHGQTPIHLACQHEHIEAAKMLIRCGADLEQEDDQGIIRKTLFEAALGKSQEQFEAKHLEKVPGDPGYQWLSLARACFEDNLPKARDLLEEDPSLAFYHHSDGTTPLHWAADDGRGHFVNLLLQKGAPVNLQDDAGETALHVACQRGHLNLAEQLVAAGASLLTTDQDGNSAADLYQKLRNKDNPEDNDGLLDSSATVERLSAYVETPSPGSNPVKRHTTRVGRMHAYVNGLLKQKMKLETDMVCIQKELEQLKVKHKKTTNNLEEHIDTLKKKYDDLKKVSSTRIKKMEGQLDTSNRKKTQEHKVFQNKLKDYAAQIVSEQKKRLLLSAKLSEQKKKLEFEGQQKFLAAKQQVAKLNIDLQVEKEITADLKLEANRLWKKVKEERRLNQELQGGIRMIEQENHKIRRLRTSSGSIKLDVESAPKLHGLTCQLENLSCDHIKTLLYNCGYGNFVENFTKQKVDGSVFTDITQQDLEDLGMEQDMAVHMMEKILALKILGVPLQSFVERHDDGCFIM